MPTSQQQQQGVAQQPAYPGGLSYAYGYPGGQHHLYYQDPSNPIPIQFIQQSAYPGTHQYNIYPQNWQQQPQQLQIISQTQPQQQQQQQQQQQAQQQSGTQQQQQTRYTNEQHNLQNQTHPNVTAHHQSQLHLMQPTPGQQQQQQQQQPQLINSQQGLHVSHGQQAPVFVPTFQPGSQPMQIPMQQYINMVNPPVPQQPPIYQKRERKPLPIVDPTTKQAVTVETTTNKDIKENNLTKSSTQPAISAIATTATTNTTTNSLSTSILTTNVNNTTNTNTKTETNTPVIATSTLTTNSINTAIKTETTQVIINIILNEFWNYLIYLNKKVQPVVENKKKTQDIQQDFDLKVLKYKQDNDRQQAATVSVVTGQTTVTPTPVVSYSASVLAKTAPIETEQSALTTATSNNTTTNLSNKLLSTLTPLDICSDSKKKNKKKK